MCNLSVRYGPFQISCRVCTLFDLENDPYDGPIALIDEFRFDFAVIAHGKRQPLFGVALEEAHKRAQALIRQLKPPRIQTLLKQAHELKGRLQRTPVLSRNALAHELGVTPTRLTMILNLLNLAPSIQKHILSLPPSVQMGPLTERSLRPLTKNRDWNFQIKKFDRLISHNRKTTRKSPQKAIDNTAYML